MNTISHLSVEKIIHDNEFKKVKQLAWLSQCYGMIYEYHTNRLYKQLFFS